MIKEENLVNNKQLIFLTHKKKETPKKVHTIKTNETLYGISQSEGIQLYYLKQYNPKAADDNLKEGEILFLFSPYDAPKKSNTFLEAIKPLSNKNLAQSAKTNSTTPPLAKMETIAKDSLLALKNKPAAKNKLDLKKKLNPFNKKKTDSTSKK